MALESPTRRLVFVSGYPGSGKSTLASRLAPRLGFPLVSKDAILLEIFAAQGLPVHEVEKAGRAAWAVFWHLARGFPQAVLDTNIKPRSEVERAELAKLNARTVEVRCVCPIEIAMRRYAARAQEGNVVQRFREASFERFAEYDGPIGLDALIEVDTTEMPDIKTVADRLRRLFGD
jgi:predicted kinase